jgi:nucleoside-diphosphate-sugar epimerase
VARSLFITGGSGFIGRHLLARLNARQYDHVYCLTRSESTAWKFAYQKTFTWLIGSIFDSSVYGSCLDSSEVVIHLAATTGKARPNQYFTVNSAGTRYLLAQCKQRGVKNFLYVSSIAAKYRDKSHYYYAQSKLEGEKAVAQSGLNYAIVRPTIVLGKGSPAWKALLKLVRLPFVVVLGDGTTRIQPIDVDDLVDTLLAVVEERAFFNETFDMGGPDAITIEEFLTRLHRIYYTKETKVIHLRREPLSRMITFSERYLSSVMPFTAGQLSVFAHDGTIESNRLYEKRRAQMKDLDTLLRIAKGTDVP